MPFTSQDLEKAVQDIEQHAAEKRLAEAEALTAAAEYGEALKQLLQAEFPDHAPQFSIAEVTDFSSVKIQDQNQPVLDIRWRSNTIWLCAPPFVEAVPHAFDSQDQVNNAVVGVLKHYLVQRTVRQCELVNTPPFFVEHENAIQRSRDVPVRQTNPVQRTPAATLALRFAIVGYPALSALAIWLGADRDLWVFAPLRSLSALLGIDWGPWS